MGTQVKIADTILKKSGDYLLAVKDNQPSLNTEVKNSSKRIGIRMKPMFRGTALLNNLTQNMGEKSIDVVGF